MNVFSSIWKDLKLLNATVYAQWFGILAVISCELMRVFWLIDTGFPIKYFTLIRILDMIFWPFTILCVEMPLVFRWRWPFFVAILWYVGRMGADNVLLFGSPAQDKSVALFIFGFARVPLVFLCLMGPFASKGNPMDFESANLYSARARVIFYLAYVVAFSGARGDPVGVPEGWRWFLITQPMSSWGLSSKYWLEPTDIFCLLAALAYFIALWAGQEYVFSRTLGGPGVERMTFFRPGRVITNDSINQEEGAIRL